MTNSVAKINNNCQVAIALSIQVKTEQKPFNSFNYIVWVQVVHLSIKKGREVKKSHYSMRGDRWY